MKTKQLTALLIAVFAAISCERHEPAASADPVLPIAEFNAFFTEQPIADAKPIHLARTTAKPGDGIVISGLIMGREKVFVDGRASFLLGDPEKMKPCNEMPGDECATPWDACCDSKEVKRGNIVSIQIVDGEGRVLSGGLKGVNGLKDLSAVTISGTVDQNSTAENLVVNATMIHVSKP
jgi:hypothetical protein